MLFFPRNTFATTLSKVTIVCPDFLTRLLKANLEFKDDAAYLKKLITIVFVSAFVFVSLNL